MMMSFLDARLPARFWDKVSPCPMSGCWLWTAAITNQGYPRFNVKDCHPVTQFAHRVALAALLGVMPTGLDVYREVGRSCHVRLCVNPAHGTQRTHRELAAEANRPITVKCPAGHVYDQANTSIRTKSDGRRFKACRACHRNRTRARRAGPVLRARP